MAIESWSKTAGSNNATPPDGFPEGMAPGSVNDSAREVMAQVRRWAEQAVSGTYASDSGSANTYVIAPAIAPSAYTTGAIYWFKAVNANSGASTLNVTGISGALGAKTIKKFTGSGVADLAAGDILANQLVAVVYDGTNMVMISPVAGLAQTTVANTFTADQTIVSTDAGAAVGPRLILDRDSASPAANDVIGGVDFQGNDSGASNETYARIQGIILDPTAASEDSQVAVLTENAGTLAARVTIGQGLQVGSPTGGDKGASTINAGDYYLDGNLTTQVGQVVSTIVTSVATGTTTIPADDTIPQNTEGDQYMTLAITPKSATSILKIDITIHLTSSAAGGIHIIAALFQDSTANALAASAHTHNVANFHTNMRFSHVMTSGTTSSTTFKIRAGGSSANTMTFNGSAGNRLFGGVYASSIVITEYLP